MSPNPTRPDSASAATEWPALRRVVALDRRWADWAARRRSTTFLYEFLRFGVKQAWACLFGGIMVALLLGTHLWYPDHPLLYRYDFLTIAAVLVQVVMLATGLETWEEAKVILAFHVTGTVMELFKTSVGAWIYPEPSVLHWGAVPLFSGFMYASVGSYMARAWRAFDFRFSRHPPVWAVMAAGMAAYINFFTHHFLPDFRVVLFVVVGLLFLRTRIFYRIDRAYRSMPLLLGLALVSLFIWFAENSGTYARAWIYPHQLRGWVPVGPGKLGAWALLMLISYAMVAAVNGVRTVRPALRAAGAAGGVPGNDRIEESVASGR